MQVLVLADAAGPLLGFEIRQPVRRYRRGIEKDDGSAVRLRLVLRELEQPERALDVDLMRGDRRELGARREQRGQVEDQIHLEFGHQTFQDGVVEDRPDHFAVDLAGDGVVEPRHVDRHDGAVAGLGEAIDQAVANLAAGAGDEHNRLSHPRIILNE